MSLSRIGRYDLAVREVQAATNEIIENGDRDELMALAHRIELRSAALRDSIDAITERLARMGEP